MSELGSCRSSYSRTSRSSVPASDTGDRDDRIGASVRERIHVPARVTRATASRTRRAPGVPAGWKPARTRNDRPARDARRVPWCRTCCSRNADLLVDAPNVTIRRVKLQGGQINNTAGASLQQRSRHRGARRSSPRRARTPSSSPRARSAYGGYTARRVKISAARGGIPRRRSIGGLRPGPDQGLVREDRHSAGSLRRLARATASRATTDRR